MPVKSGGDPAAATGRPAADGPPAAAPETTAAQIAEFRRRRREAQGPGSARAAERLHALGRSTARERIDGLLDAGSFVETDGLARHRAVNFGLAARRPPGDGVITGFGTIDGRPVCVYSQDVTSLRGSVGEVFGAKVGKILDLALRTGCPVIGINDSGGARIEEGVLALSAYGQVASRVVTASGVIPQISVIMGVCAGGAVYTAAATDFVVMVHRTSHMFVTGPDVIRSVTGEAVGLEQLGGARVHAELTGNAHYAAAGEPEALDFVRDLLSYLPSNNLDEAPRYRAAGDAELRVTAQDLELDALIPDRPQDAYDMREVIVRVTDDGEFLEIHPGFARNILCGFARVDGSSVGVVANQPTHLAGALDIDAAEKAARFVRFCDAFSIPLLTLVDVPGFLPGTGQEHGGIIRRGAKLGFAYIESTVPKVTVITRKAFGGGYAVMGSRELGADACYSWPTAEIGVMGAQAGVDLLFRRELMASEDRESLARTLTSDYQAAVTSPYVAAERGCLDAIIAPADTRVVVIRTLRALRNKRVAPAPKKHSNIPL